MSASERCFVFEVIWAHVFRESWYATYMIQIQLPGLQVVRRAAVNLQAGHLLLGNYQNGYLAALDLTRTARKTASLSDNTGNFKAHSLTVGGALRTLFLFADQRLSWPAACSPGGATDASPGLCG